MKILIFILSYNAEKHIEKVLKDIPEVYINHKDVEVLLIDDASQDKTCELAKSFSAAHGISNIKVLRNRQNQGYGGNQKVGYRYALDQGFDVVAMLHGDWQYTPRVLPEMIKLFEDDEEIDCVLGSRFGKNHKPLKGGMPLYKYVGNRILSKIQNWLAHANFSEWHTGYRVYRTRALRKIAFELNTNNFHFDTEILLQLLKEKCKFIEFNIPTHYRKEVCYVNGLKYAKDVFKATLLYRLQEYNLFFDVRFHPDLVFNKQSQGRGNFSLDGKQNNISLHSIIMSDDSLVPRGSKILNIGRAAGFLTECLVKEKGCDVVGVVDLESDQIKLNEIIEKTQPETILILEGLNQISRPELFLLNLYKRNYQKIPRFIFSTGNVSFIIVRFMLLFGFFNYGVNGILDISHKRLFSLRTFRNLLEQSGFIIKSHRFVPFPFHTLGLGPRMSRFLEKINMVFIKIRPSVFSFQILCEAYPLTRPENVLVTTLESDS